MEPILTPLGRTVRFFTSSFFRFLILLGLVFVGLAVFVIEGHLAGHFGIYGVTSIAFGIVGRLIIRWKVKDSS